jgi:hypothetical protein
MFSRITAALHDRTADASLMKLTIGRPAGKVMARSQPLAPSLGASIKLVMRSAGKIAPRIKDPHPSLSQLGEGIERVFSPRNAPSCTKIDSITKRERDLQAGVRSRDYFLFGAD